MAWTDIARREHREHIFGNHSTAIQWARSAKAARDALPTFVIIAANGRKVPFAVEQRFAAKNIFQIFNSL